MAAGRAMPMNPDEAERLIAAIRETGQAAQETLAAGKDSGPALHALTALADEWLAKRYPGRVPLRLGQGGKKHG